ncbi:MAG: TlpA disulfide reductase family protein [Halieaceae bacterium]
MKTLFPALALALMCACTPPPPQLPPGIVEAPTIGGKWVVINYWAIWCAPCREEMPELNELAREHGATVTVYGVNFDNKQGQELLDQATELAAEFPQLATDPGPQLGYARPMVLPTTIIFNPAGEMVARLLRPQTVDSILAAME